MIDSEGLGTSSLSTRVIAELHRMVRETSLNIDLYRRTNVKRYAALRVVLHMNMNQLILDAKSTRVSYPVRMEGPRRHAA